MTKMMINIITQTLDETANATQDQLKFARKKIENIELENRKIIIKTTVNSKSKTK